MNTTNINQFDSFTPHINSTIHRISAPKWNLQPTLMKNYNLALIYDGEATFNLDAKDYNLTAGSLVFSKPGVIRSATNSFHHPVKLYAVDFLYSCPLRIEGKWKITFPVLPFLLQDKIQDEFMLKKLISSFHELTKYWISDSLDKQLKCNMLLTGIINLLLVKTYGNDVAYDKVRKVNKLIEFMTEHYHHQITLDTLASSIKISPNYLCTLFKEVTNKTPTEYLLNIRINKAKELLKDGLSVTEVSSVVGFNDIYYFSKCFKKYSGLSPSQYKLF